MKSENKPQFEDVNEVIFRMKELRSKIPPKPAEIPALKMSAAQKEEKIIPITELNSDQDQVSVDDAKITVDPTPIVESSVVFKESEQPESLKKAMDLLNYFLTKKGLEPINEIPQISVQIDKEWGQIFENPSKLEHGKTSISFIRLFDCEIETSTFKSLDKENELITVEITSPSGRSGDHELGRAEFRGLNLDLLQSNARERQITMEELLDKFMDNKDVHEPNSHLEDFLKLNPEFFEMISQFNERISRISLGEEIDIDDLTKQLIGKTFRDTELEPYDSTKRVKDHKIIIVNRIIENIEVTRDQDRLDLILTYDHQDYGPIKFSLLNKHLININKEMLGVFSNLNESERYKLEWRIVGQPIMLRGEKVPYILGMVRKMTMNIDLSYNPILEVKFPYDIAKGEIVVSNNGYGVPCVRKKPNSPDIENQDNNHEVFYNAYGNTNGNMTIGIDSHETLALGVDEIKKFIDSLKL